MMSANSAATTQRATPRRRDLYVSSTLVLEPGSVAGWAAVARPAPAPLRAAGGASGQQRPRPHVVLRVAELPPVAGDLAALADRSGE